MGELDVSSYYLVVCDDRTMMNFSELLENVRVRIAGLVQKGSSKVLVKDDLCGGPLKLKGEGK